MILDLPQTPRAALAAMAGKRPELLLTPQRGHIRLGTYTINTASGKLPVMFTVISHGDTFVPQAQLLGGMN